MVDPLGPGGVGSVSSISDFQVQQASKGKYEDATVPSGPVRVQSFWGGEEGWYEGIRHTEPTPVMAASYFASRHPGKTGLIVPNFILWCRSRYVPAAGVLSSRIK